MQVFVLRYIIKFKLGKLWRGLLLLQAHSSRPIHTLPPTPLLCVDRICMLTS
mgnify:CR=1 FL=1